MLTPFIPTIRPRRPGGANSAEYNGAVSCQNAYQNDILKTIKRTDGEKSPTACASEKPGNDKHRGIASPAEHGTAEEGQQSTPVESSLSTPSIGDVASQEDVDGGTSLEHLRTGQLLWMGR